jgi:hypothetical protein
LCPRAYLWVPDHGDPHLLPCCGYLPWWPRGLNTDSWRPPWGYRHDHQVNSKDFHQPDQSTRQQAVHHMPSHRRQFPIQSKSSWSSTAESIFVLHSLTSGINQIARREAWLLASITSCIGGSSKYLLELAPDRLALVHHQDRSKVFTSPNPKQNQLPAVAESEAGPALDLTKWRHHNFISV